MRLPPWLTSVKGNLSRKQGETKRRSPLDMATQAELLQTRAMLSSVTFDSGTSTLDISLDGSDSVSAQVVNVPGESDRIEVSINGTLARPTPNASDVYFINVTGGSGNNLIDLSSLNAADFSYLLTSTSISGGDGNDTIYGSGVMDEIRGEAGDDSIDGGYGSDDVYGGDGADVLNGGAESDCLLSGDGDDTLWNGSGASDDGFGLDGECGLDTLDGVVDESHECGGGSPGSGSNSGSSMAVEAGGTNVTYTAESELALTLSGSATGFPAGSTLTYSWDLGDDGSLDFFGESPSIPWADLDTHGISTGDIDIRLDVIDNNGNFGTDFAVIELADNNQQNAPPEFAHQQYTRTFFEASPHYYTIQAIDPCRILMSFRCTTYRAVISTFRCPLWVC